jgi:hypothetical protein
MNKLSFLYAVTFILLVPTAHAMEKENPINPKVFTQEGKEYMTYAVDLWVESASLGGFTTGLAAIFKDIQAIGIDNLIDDQEVLKYANIGFDAMQKDPVFEALRPLKGINTYTYDGAKQLCADVSRVVTQAVAMNVLVTVCPDFKTPSQDIINFFVSAGQESICENVSLLLLNGDLDVKNTPYIGALTLIMGYLAQTGVGR